MIDRAGLGMGAQAGLRLVEWAARRTRAGLHRRDRHADIRLLRAHGAQALDRRGIVHALHDELLRERPESRATLLVLPDNTTAYRLYTRWGWRKAGQLRPSWPDAPLLDVLILPLPLPQ
jgi:ribosomal protein S18 acetylase RimI-like enzyme